MGGLKSKTPDPNGAKDVLGKLRDLDNNLSDTKNIIQRLNDVVAEQMDEHEDPKTLQDIIDQINGKFEEAAKDFKDVAKQLTEKRKHEITNGNDRKQGNYSRKDPAAKNKVEVQLYCAQRTDITDNVMGELEITLTRELFLHGMKLTVQTCKTLSSIQTGIPLIVICLNSTRIGADFRNAISGIPDRSNSAVLICHLLKEQALPKLLSNTILTKDEVTHVGIIIDVAFFEDMGFYDCKMNKDARKELHAFIEKHTCKSSAEGSESKEPERPPARRPSPLPKPPPSPALLSKPWRFSPLLCSEQLSTLKKRVENYRLPLEQKVKQANILFLSPVGAGKSSFFNTIDCIFQQSISKIVIGKLPVEYRQYKDRSFRLCDICGVENFKGPALEDLNYLIEGDVPDGYTLRSTSTSTDSEGLIPKIDPQDKVHCVVFLFDASSVKATDQDIWDKVSQLQNRMNTKSIPGVILLTKIDKLLESEDKDLSNVFFSKDVKRAVEYASEKLGVPLENVMPIKNHENGTDVNKQISCLALQALDRMLGCANDFLENQLDPRKPRVNTIV